MAITQTIATLPAVLNDSATFYEDIAERNNSLVTTVLPSINAWALQANTTQSEINAKAAQVAAQAVDGGYSQNYINSNFVSVNNAQNITAIKTFTVSPIIPNATTSTQAMAYGQGVNLTTSQTIAGVKTFSSTISGSINGNASTVTNGVYTTGDQTIAGVKTFSSNPLSTATQSTNANALTKYSAVVKNSGDETIAGIKTFSSTISGSINGNASTVTYGAYTIGDQTIAGVKTFSSSPIVPTPTTGTQAVNKTYADLKLALSEFTGANQSLAGNGYQKLPGGLIIQWGCITGINNASNVTINFPIAFPTACASVTGNIKTTSTNTSRPLSLLKIYSYSATSLTVRAESISVSDLEFPYIAIGY